MNDRIVMFVAKEISTLKYLHESQVKEVEDYAKHYFPNESDEVIKASVAKALEIVFGEKS